MSGDESEMGQNERSGIELYLTSLSEAGKEKREHKGKARTTF